MALKSKSGGSSRKLTFKKRSFEDTKKRSEQWGNQRDSFLTDHCPIWKPAEGENCIRILPATWEDAEHYGLDLYVHYNIGADNSAYLDLKRMRGEPDPIVEAFDAAVAEGDEAYSNELRSVKRVLVYLIDQDKPKDGPQLWAMPWTVDKEIASQSLDKRSHEILYIDDPDEGYDVVISKEGTGARTKYTVKIARTASSIELDDAAIEMLEDHPLPSCLVFHTYEHIAQMFNGQKPTKQKESAKKSSTKETPKIPTYDQIQEFNEEELIDLVENFELDIDLSSIEDANELRDILIVELEIKKPTTKTNVRKSLGKKSEAPVSKKAPVKEEDEEDEDTGDETEEDNEESDEEESEEQAAPKSSMRSKLASLRDRTK